MATYDRSEGPKEGKSAISGTTRKRIFGGKKGVGSFTDWQNQQGPVNTQAQGQPNEFSGDVRMTLNDTLQGLANLWGGGGGQQAPQWTGGGGQPQGGNDQIQNLKMWIDWMREKQAADLQRPAVAFQAAAQASDPVRYAQEQYTARQASDPWGPGGQFEKSPRLSPAAVLASQGNNATNQWAQLGGVPGIDPEELKRLNAAAVAGRGYRSYF